MLIWFLLMMQLTASQGDLRCFYKKYPKCYVFFIGRTDYEYCVGANQAIECLKEKAVECDTYDATMVRDMEQMLNETCQNGTKFNKAYLKHKECVFKLAADAAVPCFRESGRAVHDYHSSGKTDELELFNLTCRYDLQVLLCMSKKVPDICGENASGFFNAFFSPTMDLVKSVCEGNVAASFDFVWTLLLQASAVLCVHRFSTIRI